jgi:UPF0176 protein
VVKLTDEIVSFGARPDELEVTTDGVVGGGTKLSPEELHELVDGRGNDVVFFDDRNAFEAAIGRFQGAVVPDVANTSEFVAELDSSKCDHLSPQPIVTYCTEGLRCELLSSFMTARDLSEVSQLECGVARYGEAFGDTGLWDGSL